MTFDLEKARATYSAGCAEDAANLVPDLIAEIERLRGEMENYGDDYVCQMKSKDARIKELEAENINLETLNEGLLENGNDLRSRAQTAEARVQELEAALVEERARDKQNAAAIVAMADGAKQYVLSTHAITKVVFDEADSLVDYCEKLEKIVIAKAARIAELEDALAEYQRLGKIMEGRLPCLTLHGECERCSSRAKEVCDAMHQIAEGKIGPDAKQHDHTAEFFRPNESPAKSWQITDERKEALDRVLNYMDYMYPKSSPYYHCALDVSVLRAMLTEAEQ